MYSKQIRTIFRVLANAFHQLADMDEESADRLEMNGAQYLASIGDDAPDVGRETPIVTTNSAAQVFAEGVRATLPAEAATIFSQADIDRVVTPPPQPIYTMTAKADGFTREQYHASNWTDEALIEQGMMTVEYPVLDNSPNVPPAGASGTSPAISAPPTTSIPAAPQAAPANTGAPAQTGGATPPATDKTGLPWDARIHSGSRTQNADGSWKKKKGCGDVFYNQVVAELRQQQPAAAQSFAPLNAAPAPSPNVPSEAPQAAPTDFAALCKWVTSSGKTMADMLVFAKEFGMETAGQVAMPANAALIPLIYEKMNAA